MTDATPNLALPELIAAQAQKHVTVNEALRALDALVQLAVLDRDLASPPGGPVEGARWIVASGASGDWDGHDGDVAAWQDGGWSFYPPQTGWLAYVVDEGALVAWTGSLWADAVFTPGSLNNMTLLGVGTAADETNPFSAKLNNALWVAKSVAEGGDGTLRYKMSKESADKTLSVLFQDDFSGRAEIGLTGDDDFHFKVSGDGSDWKESLVIGKDDGLVRFPQGIVHAPSGLEAPLYIPAPVFEIWRLESSRPGTPRTYTIDNVSSSTVTLATPSVGQIFGNYMRERAAVRIWNISKDPIESAWVNWNNSTTQFNVTDAAHVAAWEAGETIRLGDPNPTGDNVLQMVAVDISSYLYNNLGAVFPQKGLFLGLYVASSDGPATLDFSTAGAFGTAAGGNALSNGVRNQISMPIPSSVPSPISNSNLVFVREQVLFGASDLTLAYARVLGVYV